MMEKKKPRTKWSLAENQVVLNMAINDWAKKEGTALDANGEPYERLTMYAVVPYSTLKKYVWEDKNKRRKTGRNQVDRMILFPKLARAML